MAGAGRRGLRRGNSAWRHRQDAQDPLAGDAQGLQPANSLSRTRMPKTRPWAAALATLSPANFAMVMATGIVGIAGGQQGHATLARTMLALNALAWTVLMAL